MISQLGPEKKGGTESKQKAEEDIKCKCNHLSCLKSKLEKTLDEAEDSLEREKKTTSDIEKIKMKVEGDFKLTQDSRDHLRSVQRKEKASAAISAKIDDKATLGSK